MPHPANTAAIVIPAIPAWIADLRVRQPETWAALASDAASLWERSGEPDIAATIRGAIAWRQVYS